MTLARQVIIQCEDGLHARPAMQFAELAQGFRSSITLYKGERRVDGKSIMDLLTLAADAGSELLLEVDGGDEEEAMEAVLGFLAKSCS